MAARAPYVVKPGHGERLALRDRGAAATVLADGGRTAGLFALVESVPEAGAPGLGAHLHRRSDEALYVLEGRVRAQLGGETTEADAGTFIYIPRGTVHAFAAAGPGPARVLVLFCPAGLERYLRDTAAAYGAGVPEAAEVAALRHHHDVEMA
ncbi:MAG TPA: cupin domain-containing protein [bacterium]|nr:cupin domain-containing protein [bacterium]